jgi:predicted permease
LVVADWVLPALIVLSLLLLGRSFYVLYVLKRGNRVSVVITWMAALFVVGYWTWRFGGGEWFMACVS